MARTLTRPMEERDVGRVAYLMLSWDASLPQHLRRLRGDAQQAEVAANAFASGHPNFIGHVLEVDGVVVGGIGIHIGHSIFTPRPYAQLVCWFVDEKHRGGKFHGLRLLKEAVEVASKLNGLTHLEVYPWSDDVNTASVLERLGLFEAVRVYVKEF